MMLSVYAGRVLVAEIIEHETGYWPTMRVGLPTTGYADSLDEALQWVSRKLGTQKLRTETLR